MIDWDGPARQPCPVCARSERDKTLGVTVEAGRGVAHCFRCQYVETSRGEVREGRPQDRRTGTQKHETLSEYGRALWEACRPVSGPALAYLNARQCVVPPADGDLRWHPALVHKPSGKAGPALVALVTDAVTREPLTLHRTWIQADGRKAPMDPPRMLLGGHRKAGGVIRLWPDDAVSYGLGVAEGIETALALAHAMPPVWACIDAGNLAALPVLGGIESLVIAADHDDAGLKAATECARRWHRAGCAVQVVVPPRHKADLADVAQGGAA